MSLMGVFIIALIPLMNMANCHAESLKICWQAHALKSMNGKKTHAILTCGKQRNPVNLIGIALGDQEDLAGTLNVHLWQ